VGAAAAVEATLTEAGRLDVVVLAAAVMPVGPVTDFSNFMGAVIDGRAFAKHKEAIDRARGADGERACRYQP